MRDTDEGANMVAAEEAMRVAWWCAITAVVLARRSSGMAVAAGRERATYVWPEVATCFPGAWCASTSGR